MENENIKQEMTEDGTTGENIFIEILPSSSENDNKKSDNGIFSEDEEIYDYSEPHVNETNPDFGVFSHIPVNENAQDYATFSPHINKKIQNYKTESCDIPANHMELNSRMSYYNKKLILLSRIARAKERSADAKERIAQALEKLADEQSENIQVE